METPRMLLSRRYYLGMLGALPAIGVSGAAVGLAAKCGMTNVQSFGAKGDGVTDDTNALQNACNSGQVLYFPKTSAFYKTSHFLDLSNSVYSNGAEVRLKQDGTTSTAIFRVVQNPAPLTIDGFILNGLYSAGTAGEYSAGVDLHSAVNVTVGNNTIMNTYGDSVYIGEWLSTVPCQNITVTNNTLLNPYRNNVSLIFADTVIISNNTIKKTVDYVCGIDMEPNPGANYVKNVTISGNNLDCPGQCMNACCANGIPNTGLLVQNNTATGIEFIYSDTARLSGAVFSSNTFTCKDPTRGGDISGGMFFFGNVHSTTLSSNIDRTVRAGSYKSLVQWSSTLTLTNNTFIT
ncbi:MAG: hypothetical protein M3178_09980 [Pseudomonadota bacterium]|nr:hypothetical protein [Pseudomonadota bacterium]